MIFRHYRELTTEEEAKEWFGVMPPKPSATIPTVTVTTTLTPQSAVIRREPAEMFNPHRN